MSVESVEWSLDRSPDVIIEAWAVAATINAVLEARLMETLAARSEQAE